MAFEDVGTSTMERDGPLAPSIVEQIKRAAAEKAKFDAAVRAYRAGYGNNISEEQAREDLLNQPQLLALFGATPQILGRTANVEPTTAQPASKKATRVKARSRGKTKANRGRSKTVHPKATKPAVEQASTEPLPVGAEIVSESVLPKRPIPKYKFTEDFLARLETTANKLNVEPESLLRWFRVGFLLRWDRAALEYGIPAEYLIKMNSDGTPADPARRARYLQGWDKRREALGLPPKKRVAVSPEAQIKRSRRGFKALATKLGKLKDEKPWLTEELQRASLTTRAVSKNRRVARAVAKQAPPKAA